MQTNFLIAIQSKVYEHNYERGDFFSKDQFFLAYSKAMLLVLMKAIRQHEFGTEQAKQLLIDLSFVSDLLMDTVDKEEQGIIMGFYHGIVKGVKDNCQGECSVRTDVLLSACSRKRGGAVKFPN